MIDFSDHTPAKKTEEEMKLEAAMTEYLDCFGVPYVFNVGFAMSIEETISDINKCINDGKPQTKPDYENGVDY